MTCLSPLLADPRHVRLTGLGLHTFPAELYALADTLEILDLSGNQLSALPPDLHRLHKLRILFASNNPFTELPRPLGACPQLEMVGFKACRITHVPEDSLPARLRWLILTDNRLQELPDSLGQRPRLQKLMLSCNQLRHLPDLGRCHALELLRIASNRFATLPDTLFDLPALAWLALAGNPLSAAAEEAALARHDTVWHYDSLHMGALLGEGASGHIHQATSPEHGRVALKVFKAASTSDGTPRSELAAGLMTGRHPQLLTPLARVIGHPQQAMATALPLLLPHYRPLAGPPDFDSCTRDIYAPDARIPAGIAEHLIKNIRQAVEYLHHRGVLHGDLYAHNVLWDPHTGDARLSDFGAAMLTAGLPPEAVNLLHTTEWRAFAHLENEIRARITH